MNYFKNFAALNMSKFAQAFDYEYMFPRDELSLKPSGSEICITFSVKINDIKNEACTSLMDFVRELIIFADKSLAFVISVNPKLKNTDYEQIFISRLTGSKGRLLKNIRREAIKIEGSISTPA